MSIIIETENYVYDQFEKLLFKHCLSDIENFITRFNIDVNKEDGYYLGLICSRNDIKLLEMVIKYGANVHINNEIVLKSCADSGLLNIVIYLLTNCNSDHKVLYGTTAYSNHPVVKQYIDTFNLI